MPTKIIRGGEITINERSMLIYVSINEKAFNNV
jgi:hypothetical protein